MRTSRTSSLGVAAVWGVILLLSATPRLAQPQLAISGLGAAADPAAAGLSTKLSAVPPAAARTDAAEAPYLGLPLEEALRRLQAQGLHLVFTNRLVRPEMRVLVEPTATAPRRVLDQLLAPHGLRTEDRAGGTVVVVPAPEAQRSAAITGTVLSRSTSGPVAGATVRVLGPGEPVEGRTDAAGRFEMAGLEPGIYDLEVHAPGFLAGEMEGLVLTARQRRQADLRLRPLPFLEEEIVVRPSRLSLLVDEPEAPLSFSRRDIRNLPHLARDVFRALTLLPGATANDLTAEFHIHGGRRDETQILLDGQELYDAFHLKDFDNAVSTVASQGLDRVSLSTGAFPAHRGDRMSGVLDMRTRSPSGPLRTELGLSLTDAYALSQGGLGNDRGGWLVSGRRGFVDLAGRARQDEDPLFWDLFGKLETRLGKRHRLRGHLLRAGDELDFLQRVTDTTERLDTQYDSTYFWVSHQSRLGDDGVLETTASVSAIDRDRQGGDAAEDEGFAVSDRRDTEVLGLSQDGGWQLGRRHSFEWGFLVRRYDTRYDYFNEIERDELDFNVPGSPQPVPRFRGAFRGEHFGVYVSDRFSPLERLTVEAGLRQDRHSLTDDTLTSPRLNLAWRLGDRHVLRAAWGHFYQSQRPYELQVEDGESRFFRAERSQHWVAGYEGILDPGERAPLHALRIEAYRRNIRDPRPRYENLFEAVSSFPEVEADRVRIAPDSSRAEGIEVVLRGTAGRAANWWLDYAYARARDRIGGEEIPRRIDQTHTLNVHFEQPLGAHWRLNVVWRFHTGWPTTPILLVVEGRGVEMEQELETEPDEPEEGPELGFALGPLYSQRLPAYHRLDLRASRRWTLRRGELTFFVDLQNVYDRRNVSGFDAEIDEEAPALVRNEEAWPGILPSLGVQWEF